MKKANNKVGLLSFIVMTFLFCVTSCTKTAAEWNAEGEYYLSQRDFLQAQECFFKACEKDYPKAQYNIGRMFETGKMDSTANWSFNYFNASKWYRKAAEQSLDSAQYKLGSMFSTSLLNFTISDTLSLKRSERNATYWYKKAAMQGHSAAQYALGSYFLYNNRTQDAIYWYEKSFENGGIYAGFSLGKIYNEGLDGNRDFSKAVKWIEKAIEQWECRLNDNKAAWIIEDYISAKLYLGDMYFEECLYKDAFSLYKDATECRDSSFQLLSYYPKLAKMNEYGIGIDKDYAQAVQWYNCSPYEIYPSECKYHVGRLYEKGGFGLEQDLVKARKWLELAAAPERFGANNIYRLLAREALEMLNEEN